MKNNIRVLILYTELAGYIFNCFKQLAFELDGNVRVIHWPGSANAPFQFTAEGIDMKEKSSFKEKDLIEEAIKFDPSIVYVAGWVDKDYLRIAKILKKKGATIICSMDNPWKGTLRQHIRCWLSPILIRPYFTYCWAAGVRQYEYARRLGFKSGHILTGQYAADLDTFTFPSKSIYNPYLLFVGRLEESKGIQMLCKVFSTLLETERNGWRLRCIGNGSLKPEIQSYPNVTVEDFMQPEVLLQTTKDAGAFILPSFEEHWGVVVQEFAATGLPLILSDEVNSGEKYLIHGYNGFIFRNRDQKELRQTLVDFFKLSPEKIKQMGQHSYNLSLAYSPNEWTAKLLSIHKPTS